ncbi:MAG: hypothetical protein ABJD97_14200, partial [Betaproteobacteria bacterium]
MPLSLVRSVASLGVATGLAAAGSVCAQPGAAGPQVMGWVPAYGIAASLKALDATPAIGQSLTRLGLQFWNPGADGKSVVFAPVDATGKPVTAASVRTLQRWAKAHGVQALLTVYNNSQVINRWDWPLARRAFAEHPEEFAAALVAAVDTWQLDGVDLDLEGEGDFSADRPAYAAFVHLLSTALKAKGKLLTVDSFHSPCDNAPNMRWWADGVPGAPDRRACLVGRRLCRQSGGVPAAGGRPRARHLAGAAVGARMAAAARRGIGAGDP